MKGLMWFEENFWRHRKFSSCDQQKLSPRKLACRKIPFLNLHSLTICQKLTKEDLPVNYIALSEHLDMVGVKLTASYQKTRKLNCDELQDKVKNIIGAWKGGKFMPLTDISHSLNTFCLSKVWFRTRCVNLREGDVQKINSTRTDLQGLRKLFFTAHIIIVVLVSTQSSTKPWQASLQPSCKLQ